MVDSFILFTYKMAFLWISGMEKTKACQSTLVCIPWCSGFMAVVRVSSWFQILMDLRFGLIDLVFLMIFSGEPGPSTIKSLPDMLWAELFDLSSLYGRQLGSSLWVENVRAYLEPSGCYAVRVLWIKVLHFEPSSCPLVRAFELKGSCFEPSGCHSVRAFGLSLGSRQYQLQGV